MKILIMVLSSAKPPYEKLMQSQKETWDSLNVENVTTAFYYGVDMPEGVSALPEVFENYWRIDMALPCSDEYEMMHWKFKVALDQVWDLEWDYIFRTNSSTYVRKDKIYEFLLDKPRKKYYAGVDGGGFASGTGAILSRDCAKIIKDQFTTEPSPSEDSLIGVYLQRNGIFVQPGPKRVSFNFAENKIVEADFYRCKSESMNGGQLDRTKDVYAFNELFKHFTK